MSPFGPEDLIDLGLIDLDETDADRAVEPRPGCCEDCDDALAFAAQFAAIVAQFAAEEGRCSTTATTCPSTRVHSTIWAYRQHGCRCPEAVERMRARWREQDHNPSGRARKKRSTQRRSAATRYIDQLAVDLACRGDAVRLTIHERCAAIDRLDTAGLSAAQIAERLHITKRTVVRHRAARRRRAATTRSNP